ncbi:hypothetical protein JB92DRAFT_2921815 [Gautieria morchelliformis]|nr:hypothetical protein JB92DRAFT_2921815 [Gautieria morchelliformis]
MVTLTASPHGALPPPSWDETIVPSLRKRLESESRILTKRLSTISITDEGPLPPDLSQNTTRTVSPLQSHVDDASVSTAPYPHRPSAIPRPSYSRGGERSPAPLSPAPPEQTRNAGSKRQRTHSTPFPFEPTPSTSALPNGKPTNGIPTPTASGYTSPRVQSPSLGRTTPTPSRIPTVSTRMRSGSQSSQGFGSLNGVKVSLPPNHNLSPSESTSVDSETQHASLRVKGSSASLARQPIVDERPPFANDTPPKVLQSEFTRRPSSDEERPYQHWYRGDVSRNGGVGEYRVGKRMEMLDIANFGHALRGSAGRTRPYEEPDPISAKTTVVSRKRAESVSSMERASIYIDPEDDTVTGRVLDEMPLTDLETEEAEYEPYHHPYKPPTELDAHQDQPQIPTYDNRHATGSSSTLSSRIPTSKSQTRIPQPQPRSNNPKNSIPLLPTASEPSIPAKADHTQRGRAPAPANPRKKPSSKTKGQKRSKSAADALRVTPDAQPSEYAGLADAVPDTRSPLPRDGNWDEVILPTVARRMGIEYEQEDPVAAARRQARESRVAPAPGTFAYDHTKYKPAMSDEEIPMGEVGRHETAPQVPEDPDMSELVPAPEDPPDVSMSQSMRSRRQTMPSSPPFSQYASPLDQVPLPDTDGMGRRKERQDVPHILVSPPTMDNNPAMEEEDATGCCKCVVM